VVRDGYGAHRYRSRPRHFPQFEGGVETVGSEGAAGAVGRRGVRSRNGLGGCAWRRGAGGMLGGGVAVLREGLASRGVEAREGRRRRRCCVCCYALRGQPGKRGRRRWAYSRAFSGLETATYRWQGNELVWWASRHSVVSFSRPVVVCRRLSAALCSFSSIQPGRSIPRLQTDGRFRFCFRFWCPVRVRVVWCRGRASPLALVDAIAYGWAMALSHTDGQCVDWLRVGLSEPSGERRTMRAPARPRCLVRGAAPSPCLLFPASPPSPYRIPITHPPSSRRSPSKNTSPNTPAGPTSTRPRSMSCGGSCRRTGQG
jgi:hypothetical protein